MKKFIIVFIPILFAFSNCEQNKILEPTEQKSQINLNINGLRDLGGSAWYEAWIMWSEGEGDNLSNRHKSIGLLEKTGSLQFEKSVQTNLGYLQKMLHLVITVEEDTIIGHKIITANNIIDTVAGPSEYKIVAAKVVANNGIFDIGNEQILDFNFDESFGKFILDTPTDTLNTNLKSGIWFVDLDTSISEIKDTLGNVIDFDTTISKQNGLNLPEVPSGWLYESWIVINGDTLSLGTFTNPVGADDSSKYGAGLSNGYAFPGEDFLTNAPAGLSFPTDLSGKNIFITIKPKHPENSNLPFALIPFTASIPANAVAKNVYELQKNNSCFQLGTMEIKINLYN